MVQINLELLADVFPSFQAFLNLEGKEWQKEQDLKDNFFSKYLTQKQLMNLEESTIRELIHLLWAYNRWANKDYILKEMLKSDINKIKEAFDYLLFSINSLSKRFDYMRSNVRMIGPTAISEILIHHNHNKYPIWNGKSKKGLLVLGVPKEFLPKSSSRIIGSQYQSFCKLAIKIRKQIVDQYPDFGDLFTLNYLLYYVAIFVIKDANRGYISTYRASD